MPTAIPTTSRLPKLFRAFSDPTRLRLLGLLHAAREDGDQAEVCVCDLTALLGVPQPTASRHLGYLRRVGLVTCRRHGSWCYYRLAEPNGPVHRALLACLAACAETMPEIATDAERLRLRCSSAPAADCC